MGGRSGAGAVLDEHCTQTLAGHVRQLVIGDERDLCIFVSGYPRAHAENGAGSAQIRCVDKAKQPDWS